MKLLLVARAMLTLLCAAGLVAAVMPVPPTCHMVLLDDPGGLAWKCTPLQDECKNCLVEGVCLLEVKQLGWPNEGTRYRCACTDEHTGESQVSPCYTGVHLGASGVVTFYCSSICCNLTCRDATASPGPFTEWTDACPCQ